MAAASPAWTKIEKSKIQEKHMNKIESAGLNAAVAVQTVFRTHDPTVKTSRALTEAAQDLDHLILDAETYAKIQLSPTGVAKAKAQARLELADMAYEVAGCLLALSHKSGDLNLAGSVSYSRTAINAGSTNAVIVRSQAILELAQGEG